MHRRCPETHRSGQQLQAWPQTLYFVFTLFKTLLWSHPKVKHLTDRIFGFTVFILLPAKLIWFPLFTFVSLSLAEHQGRHQPMLTPLAAMQFFRSSSAGKGRCTASSPSSILQAMKGGLTHQVLTARLVWRERRSTKACLPWRCVQKNVVVLES